MSNSATGRSKYSRLAIAGLIASYALFQPHVVAQPRPESGGAAASAKDSKVASASGFVNSVKGTVFIRRGKEPEVVLKAGDMFGPGAEFRTLNDANAVLLFADGQQVALSGNSILRIDDYRYDPADVKSNKVGMTLLAGMMRVVTGAIHTANQDALYIFAGNASLDILSKDVTAFVVEVDPKSISVGSLAVLIGEVYVQTQVGAPVTVSADQYSRWQYGGPTIAAPILAAPAELQAGVNASLAQELSSNSSSVDLQALLGDLPPTGAGEQRQPAVQAQSTASLILPSSSSVTPGGGRGCVGSPC